MNFFLRFPNFSSRSLSLSAFQIPVFQSNESPQGDWNKSKTYKRLTIPRFQSNESPQGDWNPFWKKLQCQVTFQSNESPQGDWNTLTDPYPYVATGGPFNPTNPRKGTETTFLLMGIILQKLSFNPTNPRKGTETWFKRSQGSPKGVFQSNESPQGDWNVYL